MKLWLACLLASGLVAVLLPQESEASWLRRTFREIKEVVCTISCSKICGWQGIVQRIVCKSTCNHCKRRKRDESADPDMHSIPLPVDFRSHDLDRNDVIILEEFAAANGLEITDPGTKEMFDAADRDGDGQITREEFKNAPWVFEDEDDVHPDDNGGDGR